MAAGAVFAAVFVLGRATIAPAALVPATEMTWSGECNVVVRGHDTVVCTKDTSRSARRTDDRHEGYYNTSCSSSLCMKNSAAGELHRSPRMTMRVLEGGAAKSVVVCWLITLEYDLDGRDCCSTRTWLILMCWFVLNRVCLS